MPNSTKEMIVASFYGILHKKNFEKITVKDIVEDCGINRKTFYYYFKDIYDLVEYTVRTEIERYMNFVPENQTIEETVMSFMELAEENRKMVCHISLSSDSELKRYLHSSFYDTVFKKYKGKAAELGVSERDFRLICEVLVMSFLGMISAWLDGGMKEEYKEDIRRLCIMFGGSVEHMMGKIKEMCNLTE